METGVVKTIKNYRNGTSFNIDKKTTVFDRRHNHWKRILITEVPWTFTYALRPANFRDEARLWLLAAHRVNHRYIWAQKDSPDILRDDFAKLKSRSNMDNYDRYVFVNL